ncbi:hypothetical protein, partial [Escherichia coli]|uniref:hypothetical protein n=1 Tax=Escherichia coli TaxID=562 RepID=UPI001960B822
MYGVKGDYRLLLKLGELFSGPEKTVSQAPSTTETIPKETSRLPGMAWLTMAFIPWIINWATSSFLNLVISLGLSLLTGMLIWVYRCVFEKPTWMETGTFVYFAVCLLMALLGNSFFQTY